MRYIDMKFMAGGDLSREAGVDSPVTKSIAGAAAALHVRKAAARSVQEIPGLVSPLAFLPTEMHAVEQRQYVVLVREDVFDAAVLVELASRNTLIDQLQEVIAMPLHRAVVPDEDCNGDTTEREEGSICSSGSSDAVTETNQPEGACSERA